MVGIADRASVLGRRINRDPEVVEGDAAGQCQIDAGRDVELRLPGLEEADHGRRREGHAAGGEVEANLAPLPEGVAKVCDRLPRRTVVDADRHAVTRRQDLRATARRRRERRREGLEGLIGEGEILELERRLRLVREVHRPGKKVVGDRRARTGVEDRKRVASGSLKACCRQHRLARELNATIASLGDRSADGIDDIHLEHLGRGRGGLDEAVVGVDRREDRDVALRGIELCGVFGAATDFELIVTRERLLRVGLRDGRGDVEHTRGAGGTGDHLAALGEADDDVVDVEAFVLIVRPPVGVEEVAVAVGLPEDIVHVAIGRVIELERVTGNERDTTRQRHLRGTGDRLDRPIPGDSRAGHDHSHPQPRDTVERHGRAGRRRDGLRLVGGGPFGRSVHDPGSTEVEPQLDVRLARPSGEVDAGLPP